MKVAGGIMIGKTNTPTFGWVGVTDNLIFGLTRNPWNPERTPGGSSGGAGAALAAGMAPLHIGTDGGGSIRKPSAFTGTFGLKASYGRVPVYPASAAWSVSHVGPMTRTVKDAALMLNVIAGPDERDPYSLPAERVDYVKALKGSLKGLRVAYSETLGLAPAVDPEVRNATAKAARVFRELGCRVEATNPSWASPWEPWRVIFLGGIAARLAPYLDRKKEIDAGLLAIVEESLAWPPAKYVQAWVDRLAWCAKAMVFFERYDLLLTPTVASPPFPHGILYPGEIDGVKVGRAWYDVVGVAGERREDEAGDRASQERVDQLIAREKARGVPARAIVLAGFSQGGAMALHTGLRHPERLAGVMALSCFLPVARAVATEASTANRDVSLFIAHGIADDLIPVARARAARDTLLGLGYEVEWHEYPMAHSLCPQEIEDIAAWLQRTLERKETP